MASNKHIKGHKEKIAILEAYYSNAEKIHHIAILLAEVLEELGRRGFNIKTIRGVVPEECTDGEWTFEKPEHLDCCTLVDDLGCQTLDAKPDTVPDPDDTPPE